MTKIEEVEIGKLYGCYVTIKGDDKFYLEVAKEWLEDAIKTKVKFFVETVEVKNE